jgi:hypothetical protein
MKRTGNWSYTSGSLVRNIVRDLLTGRLEVHYKLPREFQG